MYHIFNIYYCNTKIVQKFLYFHILVLPSTIPRSSATPQPLDITSSSSNDLETECETTYTLNVNICNWCSTYSVWIAITYGFKMLRHDCSLIIWLIPRVNNSG